jgi:hypothetical protein
MVKEMAVAAAQRAHIPTLRGRSMIARKGILPNTVSDITA